MKQPYQAPTLEEIKFRSDEIPQTAGPSAIPTDCDTDATFPTGWGSALGFH